MSQERFLVVKPAPPHGERAVLKPDANPALEGEGDHDVLCGECGAILARAIWPRLLWDLGILCADCGAFNDSPSAIGGTAYGSVVYLPVGTYQLGSPLGLRENALIGEAFPGAGPPAAGNLVSLNP
jgi:hypothetical protein